MLILLFFWKIISLSRLNFVTLKHCKIVSHANKTWNTHISLEAIRGKKSVLFPTATSMPCTDLTHGNQECLLCEQCRVTVSHRALSGTRELPWHLSSSNIRGPPYLQDHSKIPNRCLELQHILNTHSFTP